VNSDTATLNDMIEVLDDGQTFYQEAATRVERPDLRKLFERMARTKQLIAEDLRTAVVANGATPPVDGTFAGSLRKAYAEVRAAVSNHKDDQYVAQLEKSEDRILRSFEYAVAELEDDVVRAIARRHLPEVLRNYNEMKMLRRVGSH